MYTVNVSTYVPVGNFCPDQITPELVQIAPLPSGDATKRYCISPCPQSNRVLAAAYQKSISPPVVDKKMSSLCLYTREPYWLNFQLQ